MANTKGQSLLVIERLLRDREGVWQQINEDHDLWKLTVQMLTSSGVSLALYGIVLGVSNSWQQALSSMIKLPLLFLATLAICLPTLYLFNLVFGARLSMLQAVSLIMVSITVTAVLTLAFAPISLFFLISAKSYMFYKLLNVCILVLTAIVGLRFLTGGMAALNRYQQAKEIQPVSPVVPEPVLVPVGAPSGGDGTGALPVQFTPSPGLAVARPVAPVAAQRQVSMTLLYIWILLFGFVGTQLAWTLRPFFGDPGKPFGLFRHISGTFYADIFQTIGRLLSGG